MYTIHGATHDRARREAMDLHQLISLHFRNPKFTRRKQASEPLLQWFIFCVQSFVIAFLLVAGRRQISVVATGDMADA